MIAPEHAVLAALLLCGTGALAALLLRRKASVVGPLAFVVLALAAAGVLAGAIQVLHRGPGEAVTLLEFRSMGFALRLYVDGLSAVFLSLIAVVSVLCGLYSIEYMRHRKEHGPGQYYPNLLLFVAGMYGLVCTTDMMWFFFVFWQVMTWTGWALIRHERRRPENARAALKYLWLMQIACGATMAGAAVLVQPGPGTLPPESLLEYDFDTVHAHLPQLLHARPAAVALAFGLFLIGFGIKMGMWPFGQYWLPDAHPAAPSPVSALLSGVMIKTGVYGLMRYFIWLVPAEARADFPLTAWGGLLAVLGTVTLFSGTAQGLRQDQAKRLLAYSTIGQAGYILLGVGVTLTWLGTPGPQSAFLAAAAFSAALFHTVNHAVFKSLLFLNAGSVLHATGTQDLNKLGGLLRWMPLTGLTACVASVSISGIPLSSGFASKWMLSVAAIPEGTAARLLPLAGAVAILTSALTLALFLKFYGTLFLTRTSALVTEQARHRPNLEVPWGMRLPQAILAGLCLGLGLLPAAGFGLVFRALATSRQGLGALLADAPGPVIGWTGIGGLAQPAVYTPLLIATVMALLFVVIRAVSRWGGATRRAADPWLCGYAGEAESLRYRARHWFGAVRGHLGWLGGRASAGAGTAAEPASQPASAPSKERLSWSLEKH